MAKAKYAYNQKRKEWLALVWDGTYTETGKKHRKQIKSKKSSADLERKVNEFNAKVASGRVSTFTNQTFYSYALHWLETAKASKEINTRAMYRNIVEKHLSFLDDVLISDIKHSHFQQAINNQLDHPRTCQQINLTFRQVVKMAVKDKILPKSAIDDVLADISLPTYIKPEKRPLNSAERDALIRADLDAKKRAFVSILYYCGLRRGEALALTRFDFNWKEKTLNVNKVIIFDHGKPELKNYPKSHNGTRKIPIPDAGIEKIRPYVDSNEDQFLFHGANASMMTASAYLRMWESIINSMNVALGYNPNAKKDRGPKPIQDLTAHIFRHNYCTELCYKVPEISTKKIAKLMGDNEKMVLEVYSHIVEEKENVSETINSALAL